MRAPKITQENLENQIAGGPGGDPGQRAEPAVRRVSRGSGCPPSPTTPSPTPTTVTAPSRSLQAASLADASSFFDAYYAPGNAVLTVAGDFTVAEATALIERHFGDVPRASRCRTAPTSASRSDSERRRGRARCAGSPARLRCRLPGARSGRRLRRLPALRIAHRGADAPATRAASSSGWCRRTGWSRASRPTSARSGIRSTSAIRCCSRSRPTTRSRARQISILAVVDEELDRLATDGPEAGRARPGSCPPVGPAVPRGRRRARPHPQPGRLRAAARRSDPAQRAAAERSPMSPAAQLSSAAASIRGASRAACWSSNPAADEIRTEVQRVKRDPARSPPRRR